MKTLTTFISSLRLILTIPLIFISYLIAPKLKPETIATELRTRLAIAIKNSIPTELTPQQLEYVKKTITDLDNNDWMATLILEMMQPYFRKTENIIWQERFSEVFLSKNDYLVYQIIKIEVLAELDRTVSAYCMRLVIDSLTEEDKLILKNWVINSTQTEVQPSLEKQVFTRHHP